MDENDYGFSGNDLIASLANNATSIFTTEAALNANPLNTAIVYGGSASTPQGSTASAVPASVGAFGSSGTLLLLGAGLIVAILVLRG